MNVERFFQERAQPESKWETWKAQNQGKSTPKSYQAALNYFMSYHDIESLYDLYTIQLEAQRRGAADPLSRYIVPDMIRQAVNHRVNVEGKSGGYGKTIKSAVVKFLQLCGFEDFSAKLPRGITKMNTNGGSDIVTPQQLSTVLGVANDLQKKALVLVLKDSGLRIGDALALDVGDIIDAVDTKRGFLYLDRLTKKTGDRAQTVIGPEAIEGLRQWIRFRRDRGEQLSRDTPLFIKLRLKVGPKAKQDYEANLGVKSEARLPRRAASIQVSRLFSKAGFSKVTAHGLRKMHSTYLSVGEDRLSEPMIARLEGKTIHDSREPYKIYSEAELVEAYTRNYHQIRVHKTESTRVQQLTERLQQLERENIELKTKLVPEFQAMRKRLDRLEQERV